MTFDVTTSLTITSSITKEEVNEARNYFLRNPEQRWEKFNGNPVVYGKSSDEYIAKFLAVQKFSATYLDKLVVEIHKIN